VEGGGGKRKGEGEGEGVPGYEDGFPGRRHGSEGGGGESGLWVSEVERTREVFLNN